MDVHMLPVCNFINYFFNGLPTFGTGKPIVCFSKLKFTINRYRYVIFKVPYTPVAAEKNKASLG